MKHYVQPDYAPLIVASDGTPLGRASVECLCTDGTHGVEFHDRSKCEVMQ